MSLNSRRAPLGTIAQSPEEVRAQSARESLDILFEMSTLLNTGLDRQQLACCVKMLEDGANAEALAAVIRDLRNEGSKVATNPISSSVSGSTSGRR